MEAVLVELEQHVQRILPVHAGGVTLAGVLLRFAMAPARRRLCLS
jgi:hypothetical protein